MRRVVVYRGGPLHGQEQVMPEVRPVILAIEPTPSSYAAFDVGDRITAPGWSGQQSVTYFATDDVVARPDWIEHAYRPSGRVRPSDGAVEYACECAQEATSDRRRRLEELHDDLTVELQRREEVLQARLRLQELPRIGCQAVARQDDRERPGSLAGTPDQLPHDHNPDGCWKTVRPHPRAPDQDCGRRDVNALGLCAEHQRELAGSSRAAS